MPKSYIIEFQYINKNSYRSKTNNDYSNPNKFRVFFNPFEKNEKSQ